MSTCEPTTDTRLSKPPRRTEQSVAEWIFTAVKDDIISGRLLPDDTLVEGALANHFGVSRGPAREALQRLRRTNFLRAVPRLGYIVTSVGLGDYTEVFQMRLALEPVATELATRRIAEGRVSHQHLSDLADQSHSFLTDDSPDRGGRMAQLNQEFHHEIALLSGNRRLAHTISSVLDELQRVLILVAYDLAALGQMADDHPALVRTMLTGDAAKARELMHQQLEHGYVVMRDIAVRERTSGLAPLVP